MKAVWVVVLAACSGGSAAPSTDAASADAGGCTLGADTTPTSTESPSGCAVLDRDVSSCTAARTAAGLSGFWLSFTCRVTLTATDTTVTAVSDGLPDYKSNYFAATDPCHEDYTGGVQNPNTIATENYQLQIPLVPSGDGATMQGGVVGLAVNGVAIFGNFAAPGDDIYAETATFDRCGGHPTPDSVYHYHSEPYAISYDDDHFIGVMRDGYPVYGRRDPDGTVPADLDLGGGHTSVTVDSPATPVYHYHLSLQTSTSSTSSGEQAWFLTTGVYAAAPGACTGCN